MLEVWGWRYKMLVFSNRGDGRRSLLVVSGERMEAYRTVKG